MPPVCCVDAMTTEFTSQKGKIRYRAPSLMQLNGITFLAFDRCSSFRMLSIFTTSASKWFEMLFVIFCSSPSSSRHDVTCKWKIWIWRFHHYLTRSLIWRIVSFAAQLPRHVMSQYINFAVSMSFCENYILLNPYAQPLNWIYITLIPRWVQLY